MTVEARHLSLFGLSNLGNREVMTNGLEGNGSGFDAQMTYGMVAPLSGITTATENAVRMYGSTLRDSVPAKTAAMKSDSETAYSMTLSRKRSRDVINPPLVVPNLRGDINRSNSFTFLGEDISLMIQQQQTEIDRFISQHTEKVRLEVEESRRRYSRRIAAAVEENIMKKLRAKEEEIEKIGKLNWALEEKVKTLSVENQLWRDLAHSNEAAANALRLDLEQVLAQAHDDQSNHQADDVQSSCGSNFEEFDPSTGGRMGDRMCRSCGKDESCVLLLPCRHLCLCTVCGSSLHTCPVCNSIKTASLHVNHTG